MKRFLLTIPFLLTASAPVRSFSVNGDLGSSFDRFSVNCPADRSIISRFDPSLVSNDDDQDATWVAVFRANNNLPSVLARDSFFKAMEISTTAQQGPSSSGNQIETRVAAHTPVAVARLRKSEVNANQWVLDSMRCSLKKENQNKECDGGSEHTEAIAACIDELLLHHLKHPSKRTFEQSIRCKATLVSGPILEGRGFSEVQELCRDMATHISSLEGALEKYAIRASEVDGLVWKSPRIRDRTLQIISLLGSLDQEEEINSAKDIAKSSGADDQDEYFDPWAAMKRYL